jgi:hypothetical protein
MAPFTEKCKYMKTQKKQRKSTAPGQAKCLCARYPELPQQNAVERFLGVGASHSIFYLSSYRNRKQDIKEKKINRRTAGINSIIKDGK